MIGLGLDFLQLDRTGQLVEKISDELSYADLALTAGRYLSDLGLGFRHEYGRSDWLRWKIGKNARKMVQEIRWMAQNNQTTESERKCRTVG